MPEPQQTSLEVIGGDGFSLMAAALFYHAPFLSLFLVCFAVAVRESTDTCSFVCTDGRLHIMSLGSLESCYHKGAVGKSRQERENCRNGGDRSEPGEQSLAVPPWLLRSLCVQLL